MTTACGPAPHGAVGHSVGELATWAEAVLTAASSPSPRLDTLVLLSWLVGVPAGALIATPDHPLPAEIVERYAAWVARRAEHEPVAYITGHKAFMGLDLLVDRRALLVRPSSQALVGVVLELARLRPETALRAADVGTGSGALALALATLEPRFAHIAAVDCSADALDVARHNGARYRMGERITWLLGDLLAPIVESVDMIVANLPYLPDDLPDVAPSVRGYEPHVALFGGTDGLDVIRRFIAQIPGKLREGGSIAMEVDASQHAAVRDVLVHTLPGARVWAHHPAGRADHIIVAQLDNVAQLGR